MTRNNELIRVAKKAADAWRNTDAYYQAAQIIDMLLEELDESALTQPDEPLTLEELREMEGKPFYDCASREWYIVDYVLGSMLYTAEGVYFNFGEEETTDRFYRRPPEGEEETP